MSVKTVTVAATVGGVSTFAISKAVNYFGRLAGIPLQHGRRNSPGRLKFIDEHRRVALAAFVLIAPISEEILFREVLPRKLEELGLSRRTAEFVAAMAFAFGIHSGKDGIPVPQLLSAFIYAEIRRRHGLGTAIAAHAIHNSLEACRYYLHTKRR